MLYLLSVILSILEGAKLLLGRPIIDAILEIPSGGRKEMTEK